MTATNTGPAALADQLAAPLTVAEPDRWARCACSR